MHALKHYRPNAAMLYAVVCGMALCINSAPVFANDCYQQSPHLVQLGKQYFDVESTVQLTREDQMKIDQFLKRLVGKWEGESHNIECKGPDSAPYAVTRKGAMTATITLTPTHEIIINAQKHDVKNKINRGERLTLINTRHIFDFKFTSEKKLTFSERFRRQNQNKSARLTEVIYTINRANNQLTLNRSYYTNGVFTGDEIWTMDTVN